MARINSSKTWRIAAVLSCIASLAACSQQEAPRATVKGTVTVGGKPVEEGSIVFFPTGNTVGKSAGADIVNGSYELLLDQGPLVGSNRVEIQAFRKTGRKIPDLMGDTSIPNRPLIEEKINYVPPKYNVDSSLVHQIEPGDNTLDFDL